MSIPVSVVVVSRDRPEVLYRCVLGLSQVQYEPFEIVVVADAAGLAGLDRFEGKIKQVLFEEPNISAARNLGISNSTGDVVAFIDDDAVPEPTWLTYLTDPFVEPKVAAVGGFVLGRNGISFQWKARILDPDGFASDVAFDERQWAVLSPPSGYAVKTEGTNMAVRRSVLEALKGFDPAYHFYLDETDLNMRLKREGHEIAIAPLAQVHHGFAQSTRRRMDRVPRDLFDIGASWAVFQRKFIEETERALHWKRVVEAERKRVMRHLVAGGLEPRAVRRLMDRLHEGYDDGKNRAISSNSLASPSDSFLPVPTVWRKNVFLAGRSFRAKGLRKRAAKIANDGKIVTLLILSPTALFHHVRFHKDGYWEQSGGLFGKSTRDQRIFSFWKHRERAAYERDRVGALRKLDEFQ